VESLVPETDLDKVLRLQSVSYYWKNQKDHGRGQQLGFIAQDMEKIYPELVATDKEGMKSVNYSHLISPVVNAIKALYSRLTGQESLVQELRGASEGHSRALASLRIEKDKEIQILKNENEEIKKDNGKIKSDNEEIKKWACSKDPTAPFCKK